MKKQNQFLNSIKIIILALGLAIGVGYISAWTGPTAVAPQGNTDAPLNVGATTQYKNGPLVLNYLGSETPGLEVMGPIQIVDLTQGAGKVLMSDAAGVSHWAATSTLGLGTVSSGSNFNFIANPIQISVTDGNGTITQDISSLVPVGTKAIILNVVAEKLSGGVQNFNVGSTVQNMYTIFTGQGSGYFGNQVIIPISADRKFKWLSNCGLLQNNCSNNGFDGGIGMKIVGYIN